MALCKIGNSSQWLLWRRLIILPCVAAMLLLSHSLGRAEEDRPKEVRFDIKLFEISGNTIYGNEVLLPLLAEFTGPAKTAEQVEAARARIEKYYHEKGYPTVLVNIPEQDAGKGEIRLEVIESKIRRVRVTGNRYYTMEKILTMTPSLRPGTILYLPQLQADLTRLNRHPDLKVAPTLSPGKELGTIDVELRVIDRLPLHGSLELNNRNTHTTTDLRLNALVKYDNLWQRDHSATVQFQTSPQDTSEVQAYAGSYVMEPFWSNEQTLALYGVYSNSESAFGEGFQTKGKGFIFGLRDVFPLGSSAGYFHNFTAGLDYKKFDELLGFSDASQQDITTPITYLPISLSYGAVQMDGRGSTEITLGLNLCPRGVVSDRQDFEDKRYESRANYVFLGLDLKRTQHLGAGWDGIVQLEGQLADQPLPSNEEYSAGGMNSVSGYKESEVIGDNAVRGRIELVTPELFTSGDAAGRWKFLVPRLHGYCDYAQVWSLSALPKEPGGDEVRGVGAGLTGGLEQYLEWALQWGLALEPTASTKADDQLVYFTLKGKF